MDFEDKTRKIWQELHDKEKMFYQNEWKKFHNDSSNYYNIKQKNMHEQQLPKIGYKYACTTDGKIVPIMLHIDNKYGNAKDGQVVPIKFLNK